MKFKTILLSLLFSLDYAEDDEKNTFGKNIKGKYRPRSDFRFDLRMKCLAKDAASTGYIIALCPESLGADVNSDSSQCL